MTNQYIGRFAPSPTGRLHAGSLAAALASFIDARAHHGQWLIRIEDVDTGRCKKEWADDILQTLSALQMHSDGEVIWQSKRIDRYTNVLNQLIESGKAYGCSCTRLEIEKANKALGLKSNHYPGTCRTGAKGAVRSWRFLTNHEKVTFTDRWLGEYSQDVETEVGDFVIKRADGLFAYQLAVVIDDHDCGVTDIVRGADLIDNTPRQIALMRALDWNEPRYMHIPLVLNDRHEKLSKQAGARPLGNDLMLELVHAWRHLGFEEIRADSFEAFYQEASLQWANRFL